MLFNSYYFIFFFMPIVVACYYGFHNLGRHKIALGVIAIASFVFYAFDNPHYLLLLAGSIIINWVFSWYMNHKNRNKAVLLLGILANVAIIFYFKYFNFFVENINSLLKTDFNLRNIILPMGISFFTFQQISFLVDTYNGETYGYTFLEYISFVSYFPQLVAGPIVLHNELIPQYRDSKRWKLDYKRLSEGVYAFSIGLFKKVIIADRFGRVVVWAWGDIYDRSSLELLVAMLSYTFQIYFDFSGYCDMAIGISKMFNIDIPQNFNSPYKAVSIVDFWKRWHLTLTRFLKKYVYIPLGGNRKGTIRTSINILVVFLISGLWHGANWTFVLWGLLHGLLQVIHRMTEKAWKHMPKALTWLITFVIINFLWVMFYAPSVADCIFVWRKIICFDSAFISKEMYNLFVLDEIEMIVGSIDVIGGFSQKYYQWYLIAYMCIAFFTCLGVKNIHEKKFQPTIAKCIYSSVFMLWSIESLTGVSTFLYSNF